MTPAETYNATRLRQGTTEEWARILTIAAHVTQAALGMPQDGKLGPDTATTLERLAGHPLVATALAELGRGEQGTDNAGPDIARYFCEPYVEGKRYGEWCAALVSYCALRCGMVHEAELTRRDRLGAKRITTRIAELGRWVVPPGLAPVSAGVEIDLVAGDVICHGRGPLGAWTGHVGIVLVHGKDDSLVVLDGNSEPFPARVRIRLYPARAWRSRLWGVARLASEARLARQ